MGRRRHTKAEPAAYHARECRSAGTDGEADEIAACQSPSGRDCGDSDGAAAGIGTSSTSKGLGPAATGDPLGIGGRTAPGAGSLLAALLSGRSPC